MINNQKKCDSKYSNKANRLGEHMELRPSRTTFLSATVALLLSTSAANAVSPLDGNEDFVPIAIHGFEQVVTSASGGVFGGAPGSWSGVPNLVTNPIPGSPTHRKNSYPWAMAWYDERLFVGTTRDVGCSFYPGDPIVEPCADGLPGTAQRAEIWAYDPAGAHGLAGNWSRVYQSPSLNSFIARILGYGSVPQDLGYRNLMACDAGGTERLYTISLGVPGRVLYYNGNSFSQASMNGLNNSLFGLQSGSTDIGYRAMACFKGRLFISPLGTFADPDSTPRPILFANRNPANGGSWQNVINVKTDPTLGNPNNVGIFQMTVHEGSLYLSVGNRTEGFEIWRTNGDGCEANDTSCNLSWEKIITGGAGRPADQYGPTVDNALAGAVSFDGYLYMAAAESGFSDLTTGEVFRWDADSEVFELVAGFPRKVSEMPGNFYCPSPVDFYGTLYCQPTSGRGPGLGSNSLSYGPANYFWRAVEHEGSLFVGTLDVINDPDEEDGGFDLYKVDHADGGATINISTVTLNGLGNGLNYGVRNMVSIPENGFAGGASPMLAVGGANPYTNAPGGLEVHIGTIDPDTPPIAATDEMLFEMDAAKSGEVEVTLTGEKSRNPFGGSSAALEYQWFEGPCSSIGGELTGDCTAKADSAQTDSPDFSACLASIDTNNDFVVHDVALQVTNLAGTSCADSKVLVSQDTPPETVVEPAIPFSPQPSPFGEKPEVLLAAFDGEISADYDLEGICTDNLEVGDCSWDVIDSGSIAIAPLDSCSGGTDECRLPATVTVDLPTADGPSAPDIRLVATDIQRGVDQLDFDSSFRFESRLQPFTDNPEDNDRPVCRSGVVEMTGSSVSISLNPDFCRDPDGNEIVRYELITDCAQVYGEGNEANSGFCGYPQPAGIFNPAPNDGFFTNGTLNYEGTEGVDDLFYIRAWDAEDESRIAAVRIAAIGPPPPDEEAPTVSVAFPVNGSSYFETAFANGCPTTGICGTASDNQSGVDSVSLTIQDNAGNYWDGTSAFVGGSTTLTATGTTSWSYAFNQIGSFTVKVWATDNAAAPNDSSSSPETVNFTQQVDSDNPDPVLTFPTNTTYTGDQYNTGSSSACSSSVGICGTASDVGSGLDRVTISIKQISSGYFWNGSAFVDNSGTPIELSVVGDPDDWSYGFSPFGEGLPTGNYMVTATAYDVEGNDDSVSATYTYNEPPDTVDPSVTISYPTNRTYSGSQFDDLSSCPVPGICGTASDSDSGLDHVALTIRNGSGEYWNGGSFVPGPFLIPANGTPANWHYAFSPDTEGSYTVVATAEDKASSPNQGTANVSFTWEQQAEEPPCTFWRWIFGQCSFF